MYKLRFPFSDAGPSADEKGKGADASAGRFDGSGGAGESFFNLLSSAKRYAFVVAIEAALFFLYYYIVGPGNFDSFSDTLRYFISALATLLAVVVSFNTLALRNQIKNMPTSIEKLESELDKVSSLLEPLRSPTRNAGDDGSTGDLDYTRAAGNATEAMKQLIGAASSKAAELVENSKHGQNNVPVLLCKEFLRESRYRLDLFRKSTSLYSLVVMSTAEFIEQLRFSPGLKKEGREAEDKTLTQFSEAIKRLHVTRNICARLYIRDALANLSYELLVSTIPIIVFAAAISSISSYEEYSTFLLRILFALSLSTVVLPFILLLIRTLPILHLIRDTSSLPFSAL